jgi:hypothetical protein
MTTGREVEEDGDISYDDYICEWTCARQLPS